MEMFATTLQRIALAGALLASAAAAFAVDDAPNAKDHPLLTRYPDSHIVEYEKNYNALAKSSQPFWQAAKSMAHSPLT